MVGRLVTWAILAVLGALFLYAVEAWREKERLENAVPEKILESPAPPAPSVPQGQPRKNLPPAAAVSPTSSSRQANSTATPPSPVREPEQVSPETPDPKPAPEEHAVAPPSPPSSAEASEPPAPQEEAEAVIKGTLVKGDTVAKVLSDVASDAEVRNYVDAARQVFPLTSFRAGHPYVVVRDMETGAMKRFEYEIDQRRRLVVEGGDGIHPVARVEPIDYVVELALVNGRIDDNLFQSVADMGESPQLALQIANLFGWEINFIRDLKEGDSFSILFEKLYRDGEFKGYGRTLGAAFTNKGKTYEAFLFNDARGQENHYNPKGENLKKTLLQAPLSFTRVTSGYTKSRKHPILGDHRAHFGVDYGAPTGTPVKAVGDGVITLRGWIGGYGNQVVVRHAAGLESMYSHLSSFGRGAAKGSRVRQGQVIGYVGSTGYATGPHLDFRLKQHGRFINPINAVNPRSESVPKNAYKVFEERMALVRAFMDGARPLSDYTPDMAAKADIGPAAKNKEQAAVSPTEEGKKKPSRKKRRE